MPWTKVFLNVTMGALIGMVLGGAFGFFSGAISPDFFRHIIPWQDVEPRGFATFIGATVGVILGGGLAVFAILLQAVLTWRQASAGK